MLPAPVPGEADIDRGPTARNVVLLRNIRLGSITNERRVDALLDTGATYCVVPASVAFLLGFNEGNRLGKQAVNVVGGRIIRSPRSSRSRSTSAGPGSGSPGTLPDLA